jgi:hypothetical protein
MKKLYVVEVAYRGYVWAEDEDNAESFASEITADEEPEVYVDQVRKGTNPLNWPRAYLVYHAEQHAMELGEAFRKMEEE